MLSNGKASFMKMLKWIIDGIWYCSIVSVFLAVIGIPGVSLIIGKSFFVELFTRAFDLNEFLSIIIVIICVSVYFLILFQLRKLVKNIIEKRPFELINYYRLRIIGLGIIVLGINQLWYFIISWGYGNNIIHHENTSFMEILWMIVMRLKGLPYEYILTGLSVLCIAEAFKIGAEMREEEKLTI